jgi:hypothetical protein
MHSHRGLWIAPAVAGFLAGCGGGGSEPLISGSATGDYDGTAFTATSGFAITIDGDSVIGVGDADLDCGSATQNDPPGGRFASIEVPSFELGSYTQV